MPHYSCAACHTRRRLPAASPTAVGHLCPQCGSLLTPVSGLPQLVALRAGSRDGTGQTVELVGRHAAIADQVRELLSRRALRRSDRDGRPAAAFLSPATS